jgi:Molybdopterin-binding domain of aldehyde dehydrogenase
MVKALGDLDPGGATTRTPAQILKAAARMSPRTAASQVRGGVVWGIGAVLREASEVNPRYGGFLNADLAEYVVPVNADIGSIEVDFIDRPDDKFNSAGVKGLGEVSVTGVGPAIANAVYHATGRRLRELPIGSSTCSNEGALPTRAALAARSKPLRGLILEGDLRCAAQSAMRALHGFRCHVPAKYLGYDFAAYATLRNQARAVSWRDLAVAAVAAAKEGKYDVQQPQPTNENR